MPLLRSWEVLCWNIRGINSDDKQLALNNAIRSSGCSVVCIQETKKTLLSYPLLNPVALDNLISLHMSHLKELWVACLLYGKALCLLVMWCSRLILPWSLILLALYHLILGR